MPDDVLSIEVPLVLKWCELPEMLSAGSLRQGNRLAFSLLESLNEQPSAAHDAHHSSPELQRIENKLNMLIEMVSQLSEQSQQPSTPVPVRLSCKEIEWLSDTAVAETALLLELYLDAEMPHGLKIISQLVSITEQDQQYRLRVRFTSLDEMEENHLEKWIFTHHRRRVAQARSQNSSS